MSFQINSPSEKEEVQHHQAIEVRKGCPPYVQEDIFVLGYDRPPQFEGSRDQFLIISWRVRAAGDGLYVQVMKARFFYDFWWRIEVYRIGQFPKKPRLVHVDN
jgi:hypothetical protein